MGVPDYGIQEESAQQNQADQDCRTDKQEEVKGCSELDQQNKGWEEGDGAENPFQMHTPSSNAPARPPDRHAARAGGSINSIATVQT